MHFKQSFTSPFTFPQFFVFLLTFKYTVITLSIGADRPLQTV